MNKAMLPAKADADDVLGRYREVIADPLNLLIERVPKAGIVEDDQVYLHNGIRVPVGGSTAYYGPFSQLLVLNRGVHEPLEEFVFQEMLKVLPRSPLMIELGAYWAHYSMWLLKQRPDGIAIMVEPQASNLMAGQSNFTRNGFKGEFIHAAVGSGHWELDPFLQRRNISRVDILHVDIQGHEAEMLRGAREAFGKAAIDYVFISTHSQQLHEDIKKELSGFEYCVEVSSDFDNETTSHDGLIFASAPHVKRIFQTFPYVGRAKAASSSVQEIIEALFKMRNECIRTRGDVDGSGE